MTLIIRTCEEAEASLSHGAILCTKEQLDEYYLMHYRTRGSKNGERRYQDEHGRLTPEGYQHYAEMYGWNKKLNKISKTEEKSDRLKAKGDKADLKAAKAKVKYDKAEIEANSAARRVLLKGAPANKAGSDVQSSISANANYRAADYLSKKAKADKLHLKALKLDNKAVKLADQLQRKENKMSKYVDENGNLNEKALEKYTYATGVPGERKMSLVGRMKFGNEYTKKFNEKNANDTEKELRKLVSKDFDGDKVDRKTLEKEWLDSENKKFDEMSKAEDADRDLSKRMLKLDSLSSKDKARTGDEVLSRLSDGMEDKSLDEDSKKGVRAMQDWLVDRVYEKAGSINAGDYKPGTNAEKAEEKARSAYQKLADHEDTVKAQSGFKSSDSSYNNKKLAALLSKDSTWKKLDLDYTNAQDDVMGAILKDLGFNDTPANRSTLYAYGWWD